MAEEQIHETAEDLYGDDDDCQAPSPQAAMEPAYSGERKQCAQGKERNPREFAERGEALISRRIQKPHAVESGAWPHEGGASEEGHERPEKQENADRGKGGGFGGGEHRQTIAENWFGNWNAGWRTQVQPRQQDAGATGGEHRKLCYLRWKMRETKDFSARDGGLDSSAAR